MGSDVTQQLLTVLCTDCIQWTQASGASVALMTRAGTHLVIHSSDALAADLAEVQFSLGEGPGLRAFATNEPVYAADLTDQAITRDWPIFAGCATRLGVAAVFAFPLTADGGPIGVLDLHRRTPRPMSGAQVRSARVTAHFLAEALASAGAELDAGGEPYLPWLDAAAARAASVHRATGFLAVHLGMTMDQALAWLRAQAFVQGRSITSTAEDLLPNS